MARHTPDFGLLVQRMQKPRSRVSRSIFERGGRETLVQQVAVNTELLGELAELFESELAAHREAKVKAQARAEESAKRAAERESAERKAKLAEAAKAQADAAIEEAKEAEAEAKAAAAKVKAPAAPAAKKK